MAPAPSNPVRDTDTLHLTFDAGGFPKTRWEVGYASSLEQTKKKKKKKKKPHKNQFKKKKKKKKKKHHHHHHRPPAAAEPDTAATEPQCAYPDLTQLSFCPKFVGRGGGYSTRCGGARLTGIADRAAERVFERLAAGLATREGDGDRSVPCLMTNVDGSRIAKILLYLRPVHCFLSVLFFIFIHHV
jgi:hypothetical protein